MDAQEAITLESSISLHPWTGWHEDGRCAGETNSAHRLVEWGARFVRKNETGQVYRVIRFLNSMPFDLVPVKSVNFVPLIQRSTR